MVTKESWKNADGEWQSRTCEYEKDGIRQRVFDLCADTIGKLDRAERRDPVEISSEAD